MNIIFTSKKNVEVLFPKVNAHLISISDGEFDEAEIDLGTWASCSFHHFIDDEYNEEKIDLLGRDFMDTHKSYISICQAEELIGRINWIIEQSPKMIVVNCRAGKSRSAAVAKYISELTGREINGDLSYVNQTVYRLLKRDHSLIFKIKEAERMANIFESKPHNSLIKYLWSALTKPLH